MPALSHALFGLTLFGSFLISSTPQAGTQLSIEVFTTTEFPISGKDDLRLQGARVTEYFVDGLKHVESTLSESLPNDAETAKAEALRRIEQLDGAHMVPAKSAAIGLAKAVHYGVDRYPAIVLDVRAVVYGVTDLVEAIDRYEAWQREQAR
jgi:integrating conjugative element protein (TIGR03757 family)